MSLNCKNCANFKEEGYFNSCYGRKYKLLREICDNFDPAKPLSKDEFTKKYCSLCGSQRCGGVDSEFFKGCEFKALLKRESR